jgi:hypothetical protein
MKRFAIATVLAAVVGLATASTADAQYIIQNSRVTPNGGLVVSNQLYNLGTYQRYNNYVSPWGTVGQSAYYSDIYGNSYGRAAGYNTWNGNFYNRGFYQPSPFVAPYGGGYNYNFYRRW